jgi:predicted RNA-binding protein with PUA-like domain
MNYWLVKTEPETFSWNDQKNAGIEPWNGVRNYQARNNMKLMKQGDLVLFYHSGGERQVVGIISVEKEFYPDIDDDKFVCVDVKTVEELKNPITLASIKGNPKLAEIPLVKHSRLSVMPLTKEAFDEIIRMSE